MRMSQINFPPPERSRCVTAEFVNQQRSGTLFLPAAENEYPLKLPIVAYGIRSHSIRWHQLSSPCWMADRSSEVQRHRVSVVFQFLTEAVR